MSISPFRISLAVAIIASATLGVSACTINIGTSSPQDGDAASSQSESGSFSSQDIMFAQMMIPHHQQAVDMGTLAETRALNPDVKALAETIKNEQAPEIEQMTSWLTAANAPMEMGHHMDMDGMGMGMDGMLSDADMTALENAQGAEFDRLYLQGMIAHHKGAIQMAEMVRNSSNAEVKALAEAIISSQTEQITYMESLLGK